MPLQPKFREIMLNGTSENWTLRFWFNAPQRGYDFGQRVVACERMVKDIMVEIIVQAPSSADTVEDILLTVLDGFVEHGCAAYEILLADTRCGVVGYFEWP